MSRTRTLTVLGAATLLALTACGGGGHASDGGIILPAGLTTYDQIADIVNNHDMVVRVQTSSISSEMPGSGPIEMDLLRQPNGNLSIDATFMGETQRFIAVDGVAYIDEGDGWVEDPEGGEDMPASLMDVLQLGSALDQPTVTETDTGYTLASAQGETTLTLTITVDGDRRLVSFTIAGELQEAGTVTYPNDQPAITAPADARPAPSTIPAEDGTTPDGDTMTDDQADEAAKETLGEASRIVVELIDAGTPLADITPDMVDEELMWLSAYLDIETAFDPWSVGFANDGSRIELVTSNGRNMCWRTTIEPDDMGFLTLGDSDGARTDLGYACGTTITHTGSLLGEG